jgi:hypothetical protein
MSDATSVLFGLEHEFSAVEVRRVDATTVKVITERLRQQVAMAIASGNRAVSEVVGEYGVSWPTAHKAVVVAATKWLPEPPPTPRLGSMRPGSDRSAGSWMGLPGSGPTRG